MATNQKLRGMVGQGMDGRRASFDPYAASYPVGSYTWTCPRNGYYRFVNWGTGGNAGGGNSGTSGAHTQTIVHLAKGQTVAVVVGAAGVDSTFTFPTGRVVTAGAGVGSATVGVATGGDINLNGSLPGATAVDNGANGLGDNGGLGGVPVGGVGGGAGAPGQGPFRGGDGGASSTGAGATNGAGTGYGFAIIVREDSLRA